MRLRRFRVVGVLVGLGLGAALGPAHEQPACAAAQESAAQESMAVHPWAFTSRETLLERVPTAPGFTRAAAPLGSFAAFLRTLPLAPRGTPVVDFRGAPLYDHGEHPNIAAVVDVDVGSRDLQQCADAVLRMNAEYRYGRGERNVTYHAASGLPLSYQRWLSGERVVIRDGKADLHAMAAPRSDSHVAMRTWLDDVFAWANTSSLAREGTSVPWQDVRAGDFFVMQGSPFGHAVLVVDVAHDAEGRTALLLAQSYMPAQSFQVLTPGAGSPWFVVQKDDTHVKSPFWAPFPKTSLRRLPQ
jgi:hypothetical protein